MRYGAECGDSKERGRPVRSQAVERERPEGQGAPGDPAASALLLDWYDSAARALPWRVGPAERRAGSRPDPYRVWLSEIMLQQTTVAAVKPYFERFTARWPDVEALAGAYLDEVLSLWAGLGYYARARNLHKCAGVVAQDHGGRFPQEEGDLLSLPGVGPYTAAAIAAIAFDRRAVVVDGNVERVMARLHALETPLPAAKPELIKLAEALTPDARPGDYAQGVMDLGATICTPKSPACGICPWRGRCRARVLGIAADLPRKAAKKARPVRFGVAYIAVDEAGAVLLRKRPESGLLGGMLEPPGTDWTTSGPDQAEIAAAAPISADWRDPGLEARHIFTHFHLRLGLRVARVDSAPKGAGRFVAQDALEDAALPTAMRKAVTLGLSALREIG